MSSIAQLSAVEMETPQGNIPKDSTIAIPSLKTAYCADRVASSLKKKRTADLIGTV